MKALLLVAILSLPAYASHYIPKQLRFKGSFQTIVHSASECEGLITTEEFLLTHVLTGASGRTSVLNFKGQKGSYFHNLTLVGGFGYSNDFLVEKNFAKDKYTHRVVAKGLVDYGFLMADVTVTLIDKAAAKVVCTANAEIYAN